MAMFEIDFEAANKLQWTNPHIDFAVGISLFLKTYLNRPESLSFLDTKSAFESDCLYHASDLPEFAATLRRKFQIQNIGRSRQFTNQSMSMFVAACLPAALILTINRFTNPAFRRYAHSIPVKKALEGYLKYQHQYIFEYSKIPLGGIWTPNRLSIKDQVKSFCRGLITSKLLLDKRITILLDYVRNVTELCYCSELQFWWAPMYLITKDILTWVGPVPIEEIGTPTPDGILGTIFPRQILSPQTELPSRELIGNDNHFEWLLISMSEEQSKQYLGIPTHNRIIRRLKKWGYNPAHKWKKMDFNMCFDRILAHKSIEFIAEQYSCDPATVKRRTGNIANILSIPLPKAPHKKHRHN